MANKQSQNDRREYQIDEITYAKRGYPKRVHMRTRKREFEKSVIRYARTKMNGPKQMLWSIFCALVGQVHHHQGKCRCFLPP